MFARLWYGTTPEDDKKKQEEKHKTEALKKLGLTRLPPNATITVGATSTTVRFCEADACTIKRIPHATTQMASASSSPAKSMSSRSFYSAAEKHEKQDVQQSSWASIIPNDWYELMKEAAKQGCLFSFLNGFSEEFVSEQLTKCGWKEANIYWVNQSIRALTTLCFGATLVRSAATPLANAFLMKYVGLNVQHANYVTTGGNLAFDLATSPLGLPSFALTLVSGIGGSFFGGYAAKSTYKGVKSFINHSHDASENTLKLSPK